MRSPGASHMHSFGGGSHGRRRPVFADVHCHCLPSLDDGPANVAESLALCRALVADGIATVVATPHQLGRYDGRYDAEAIRQAVAELNMLLDEANIPLDVLPGADVRIDERIVELLDRDRILTVGDRRRTLLLELPHEVFVDPEPLLAELDRAGWNAVITHPERHGFLAQHPHVVRRWLAVHPCLQLTAGSLLGGFGGDARQAAWAFLAEPLPLLVATDAHDTASRGPCMTAAYHRLAQSAGPAVARILCIENPRRLLDGRELLLLNGEPAKGRVRR